MAGNDNRKSGNAFERELCEYLAVQGYWAHNLAQKAGGQPFDVIAAKNGSVYAIDCKVCKRGIFQFSRVEENQRSAMRLWHRTGNGSGYFALKLPSGAVYMLHLPLLEILERGQNSLNEDEIKRMCTPLHLWV